MGTMFSLIKVDVSKAIRFIMTGFHMWNPIYTQTYTACPFGLVLTFYSPFWRICLSSERGCPALPEEPWQSAFPTLLSVSDYESGLRSKHKWLSVFIKLCLCLECSQCLSDAIQLQVPAASTPGHQTRGPKCSPVTPKAEWSPPKPPQQCQKLLQPLLSSWLPQAMEVCARTWDGLKTGGRMWQPPKAELRKRKHDKTCAWCQQGNSCHSARILQYFAVPEAQDFVIFVLPLKNNTRGWGTSGCCQRLHPQRKCSLSTARGAQCTEKSAQSIFPILDALY